MRPINEQASTPFVPLDSRTNPIRRPESAKSDFMSHFLATERKIRAFARALTIHPDDAEEVFQQAAVTMLEKYEQREAGVDFTQWACRIVIFKVMEFRQKHRRDRLRFSTETLDAIARDGMESIELVTDRSLALERCLEQLQPQYRQMIAARYVHDESVEAIAKTMGRTVQAVYRALSRSRRTLHECMTQAAQRTKAVT